MKKIYIYSYFNHVSQRKDLISRYFALMGLNRLKTVSPFNFALKDMYNMSYIQTLFY